MTRREKVLIFEKMVGLIINFGKISWRYRKKSKSDTLGIYQIIYPVQLRCLICEAVSVFRKMSQMARPVPLKNHNVLPD